MLTSINLNMVRPAFLRRPARGRQAALATLAGLALVVAWDATGLDLPLALLAGSADGFAARDHWLLTRVLHDGARQFSGLLLAVLALSLWLPVGPLRDLPRARRAWLLVTVVGGMLAVSAFKRVSATSCPWDLQAFGGRLPLVPHWNLGLRDGGPGHCFPAGHASAALAWVACWFAWPSGSRAARAALAAALVAGLVLGVAQQLRGAHFMSHTLWTAWICWTWAWLLSAFLPADDHAPAAR